MGYSEAMTTPPPSHSYKELPVWQRSMRLVADIYGITAKLPAAERLGLSHSLQTAAISLTTLLAGGSKAGKPGFALACRKARSSAAEVETLLLVVQITYPDDKVTEDMDELAGIETNLTEMIRRLENQSTQSRQVSA